MNQRRAYFRSRSQLVTYWSNWFNLHLDICYLNMISRPLKALQCRVIFGKTFSKSSANCGARRRKQWIWVLLNYASHQVLLLMLSIKTPFSAHFNKLLANLKMPINIQMRDKNVDDCACTICIGKLMNYRSLWFMGTVNKDADRLVSGSQVI